MWDEPKRRRFQELRDREGEGRLTEAEQIELGLLLEELDAAEAAALTPAMDRLRRERQMLEAQNQALEAVRRSQAHLVERLEKLEEQLQGLTRRLEELKRKDGNS